MSVEIACSSLTYWSDPSERAFERVRALGFTQVDLGVLEDWAHVHPSTLVDDAVAIAERLRGEAQRAGVEIVALNAGLGTEDLERRARGVMRLGQELGVRSVTLGAPPHGATLAQALEWAQPLLVAVREHPELVACVEFHTLTFTEVIADCVAFVEETGFGITFDCCHYYIGPAQGQGIDALLPHIRHVHVRDCGTSLEQDELPWGTGVVDLPMIVERLRGAGYEGAFSIEYIEDTENFPGDIGASVVAAAQALRALTA